MTHPTRLCSCDRVNKGRPWDGSQCRLCWLYHHNSGYNRFYGGCGEVYEVVTAGEPGLLRKAANLVGEVTRYALGGFANADERRHGERLKECRGCLPPQGFFDAARGVCTHPTCGCNMEIKAWLETAKCPIGKW